MDDNAGDIVTGNADDTPSGVKIEFSDVWFRYPAREAPVLSGLNLTVCQNQ